MKKITVLPNRSKDVGLKHTEALKGVLDELPCEYTIYETIPERIESDLVVVLGGDGSIMRAARRAALTDVPVLGINLGRVGYLAELEPYEIGLISEYFNGNYRIERRMMLEVTSERDGRSVLAINDAVITSSSVAKMVELSLYAGSCPVGTYRADGAIFATPTGSTAYSMAAGGPVIDPCLDCICVTPICPHSLRAKPLIFGPDVELEAVCGGKSGKKFCLTADGNESMELETGDTVRIRRSDICTNLIRIKRDGFFSILNAKMSE